VQHQVQGLPTKDHIHSVIRPNHKQYSETRTVIGSENPIYHTGDERHSVLGVHSHGTVRKAGVVLPIVPEQLTCRGVKGFDLEVEEVGPTAILGNDDPPSVARSRIRTTLPWPDFAAF